MTGLQHYNSGDSFVRCSLCRQDAAGPCARCRRPVCGDCCVLVQGAAQQWAICTSCKSRDRSGSIGGWGQLAWLVLKLLLALLAILLALGWLAGDLS